MSGGKREGAGRPYKFGEPMKQMRIPLSLIPIVEKLLTDFKKAAGK